MHSAAFWLAIAALVASGDASAQTTSRISTTLGTSAWALAANTEPISLAVTACDPLGWFQPVVCRIEVTVTPNGTSCDVAVNPAAVLVEKGSKARDRFRIVWTLKLTSGDPSMYSFDLVKGIEVLQGANKLEFEDLRVAKDPDGEYEASPAEPANRVTVRSKSRSGLWPFVYHYNINVLRKDTATGTWPRCGGIDPLIVNVD